jgi:hypothetical protein
MHLIDYVENLDLDLKIYTATNAITDQKVHLRGMRIIMGYQVDLRTNRKVLVLWIRAKVGE